MEKEAIEQMKGFYDKFVEEMEANGLTSDDLKGKSNSIASYFRKLNNGILGDDIRNKTVEACLESANNWATKTSPTYATVVDLANSVLMEVLQDAETFRSKNNQVINSCRLSLQHLNKLRLLTHIDQ